jgi:hypothetical protein
MLCDDGKSAMRDMRKYRSGNTPFLIFFVRTLSLHRLDHRHGPNGRHVVRVWCCDGQRIQVVKVDR